MRRSRPALAAVVLLSLPLPAIGPVAAATAAPGSAAPVERALDEVLDAQRGRGIAEARLDGSTAPVSVLTVEVAGSVDPAVVGAQVDDVAAALGGDVRSYDEVLGQVSVEVPRAAAAEAVADLEALPAVADVDRPVRYELAGTVNDTAYLSRQRSYLQPLGLETAWSRSRGAGAVVAVIDTGIDAGHTELDSKVIGRYDAVYGGTYVEDFAGHGTAVAGVAAAETNNARGMAGVGRDARLLVAKVDDEYGGIYDDAVARAIRWAAARNADVINMSLGGPGSSPALASAVSYARARGVVVVASAGNEGTSVVNYPAGLPGVLAVGATSGTARASFSSYGSWVDVAAPGVGIYATAPGNGYTRLDGTSFSAPIVAGQAALIRARGQHLSESAVRSAIVASGTRIGGAGLGTGRVSISGSMQRAFNVPPSAPRSPKTSTAPGRLGLAWTAPATTWSAIDRYEIQVRRSPSGAWRTVGTAAGTRRSFAATGLLNDVAYDIRVRARNAAGSGPYTAAVRRVVAEPTVARSLAVTPGSKRITATWAGPASAGGSPITHYWVEYGTSSSTAKRVKVAATRVTLSGLVDGRAYSVRVAAANRYAVGPWSTWARATPASVASAPRGVTATSGDGQVTVSWAAPASNGGAAVTGYRLRYRAGVGAYVTRSLPRTGSTVLTPLVNGTAYEVSVAAVNRVGTGPESAPVVAVPLAPPTVPTTSPF